MITDINHMTLSVKQKDVALDSRLCVIPKIY